MTTATQLEPGGFWIRFVATMIDGTIISVAGMLVGLPVGILIGILQVSAPDQQALPVILSILNYVVNFAIGAAFVIYFYTKYGATPGKLLFGMRVLDIKTGLNMSWKKVLLREYVCKFISTIILFIGFIVAGFRSDKRALHDLLADTCVVRKR